MSDPLPFHLAVKFYNRKIVDQFCTSKWRLTHVNTITVSDNGTGFCKFLSSPMDLGEGRFCWPVSSVREIVFQNCRILDAEVILEMVKHRTAASRGAGHGSLAALEEVAFLGNNYIAEISLAERAAGKQRMTYRDVVEAANGIVAEGLVVASRVRAL
ncbi:hypothetical protein FRB95_013073 [Tulasnella sp. JGI-2019a]|nr:hypothetical protein FRB95_013073 [Tulasnella sp. JGI-2019a]